MWCYEDKEMKPLKVALNRLRGITCFEWCHGHGKWPAMVRFAVKRQDDLMPIYSAILSITPNNTDEDARECEWAIEIEWNLFASAWTYRLRGPIEDAQDSIDRITAAIERARP